MTWTYQKEKLYSNNAVTSNNTKLAVNLISTTSSVVSKHYMIPMFQIAAFFAESLPSVGGQIIPPAGYFQKVAE